MNEREFNHHSDNLLPLGISILPSMTPTNGKTVVSISTSNNLFPYGEVGVWMGDAIPSVLYNGERVEVRLEDVCRYCKIGFREEYFG